MSDELAPRRIAYFSMEVALENEIPTYSGGLGVLAGDTLRSAADLGLAALGVTLLHRRGYFRQRLDESGRQSEDPVEWEMRDWLQPTGGRCAVELEGRPVWLTAWRFDVRGVGDAVVPVLLLDADLEENAAEDRRLTDRLYGGDERYRLCQEALLGMGGVRMLQALGHAQVERFHMNEGHSALLALELYRQARAETSEGGKPPVERVRRRCVFTTHTPIPAGHDRFPLALARSVLGEDAARDLGEMQCLDDELNMTLVAMRMSHHVNGVAMRHGEVSRTMFPGHPISAITNGVHSATWTGPAMRRLFDREIPDWRRDSFALRYALGIRLEDVRDAHLEGKRELLRVVEERSHERFEEGVFTIGFARRATAYKRPGLLFQDPARLRRIAAARGPLQVVLAGKAHPRDEEGKRLIESIFYLRRDLAPGVRIAYLADYDLALGRLLTAGVDLWLNTPKPPQEASGTSGMKAAHNGVPSLSILDGWWLEGCLEGITGWSIGDPAAARGAEGRLDPDDAADLYAKLESAILPVYYGEPAKWLGIMRSTIAFNASFFNTQRMLQEYVTLAYDRPPRRPL